MYQEEHALCYCRCNRRKMSNEHDWLSKCVKEIDVTDVGEKNITVY